VIRYRQLAISQLVQQLADLHRGNVAVIRHRDQFVRNSIECAQDIEALPAARSLNEHPHQRPEKAQKGR